jgi:hypothetical protein
VQDNDVLQLASRSWSTFAATGAPSAAGKHTLQGWEHAYASHPPGMYVIPSLYIIGGPFQSFAPIYERPGEFDEIAGQYLIQRCGLLNSPEFIGYLQY